MQHYPRLSPSGESVAAGDTRVFVNGAEIGHGRTPQWQDEDTIICLAPAVGVWRYRKQVTGQWAKDILDPNAEANDLSVSAAGWAYYTTKPDPRIVVSDGRTFDGYGAPAFAPDGRLAMAKHADGSVWVAQPNQTATALVCSHPSRDLRWTDAGLSFTAYPDRVPQVWTWYLTEAPLDASVVTQEYACAVAKGPGGVRWVLSIDDTRLLFRPDGSKSGYILGTQAQTFNPDVRWVESKQRFRVVWASSSGVMGEAYVDPATDRVDLRKPVTPPVVPPPTPVPVPEPVPNMSINITTFRTSQVAVHRDASDIFSWPITSRVKGASASGDRLEIDHSQCGRWPEVPYEDIKVEGALWVIAQTPKGLRAATIDRLRPGQWQKGMNPTHYGHAYALDVPGWTLNQGDVFGLMASTPARDDERGPVNERSQIAWVEFGTGRFLGVYNEDASPVPTPTPIPTPIPTPQPQPPQTDPAVLAALERISVALVGLNERMDRETAIIAEWLVDASGHIKAVGDNVDGVMHDLHTLTQGVQKQIAELSLPIEAKTRFLNQNITFSGTVGKR